MSSNQSFILPIEKTPKFTTILWDTVNLFVTYDIIWDSSPQSQITRQAKAYNAPMDQTTYIRYKHLLEQTVSFSLTNVMVHLNTITVSIDRINTQNIQHFM